MGAVNIRRQHLGLLAALALQGVIGGVLIVGEFTGPDATSYMDFVLAGQEPSYWLDTNAFQGNFFPMGYPAILTVVTVLTGGSTFPYEVLSILLGLSTTAIVFGLLRGHAGSIRVTAALAVAMCPSVLWMMQNNGYEMLLSSFITASAYMVWRLRSGPTQLPKTLALSAGIMLGVAGLVQSKVLVLLPIYLVLLMGNRLHMVLMALGSVVAPGLWGIRNFFVVGNPYPFSSNAGMGLWLGNNPFTVDGGVVASMPTKPPGTSSLAEAAIQFVVSQPEAAFTLFGRRVARLLSPTYLYREGLPPELNTLLHWYAIAFVSAGVLLFAAFVFGRLWVRFPVQPDVTIIAVVVMAFFVVHFPFQSEPRYMTPVVPLAIAVVVPTAFAIARRVGGRSLALISHGKTS